MLKNTRGYYGWYGGFVPTLEQKNTIFSNPSVVLVNLSVPKCFEKFCDPLCLNGNVGDGLWVGID